MRSRISTCAVVSWRRSIRRPDPYPCLALISTGPFYAVEVVVGDLGTFAGLRTDGQTRVLDPEISNVAADRPARGVRTCRRRD
jgi:hypothetical protein